MATNDILAGYMGILSGPSGNLRVTSFNVNAEQTPLYYDHTIGLRDSIPTTLYGGKGDTGFKDSPQKSIYRPSVIGITGSFSFPLYYGDEIPFLQQAKTGDDFDMTFYRDCENGIKYSQCKISSYQFSMTAGEVPNISVSVMARNFEKDNSNPLYDEVKKLVTWDICSVEVQDLTDATLLSFNMTVTNECKYIYTAGSNNLDNFELLPAKLRVGFQSIQGNMTFYRKGKEFSYMDLVDGEKEIKVSIEDVGDFTINCVYVPIKREGQPGPITSTLRFYGVGSYWL